MPDEYISEIREAGFDILGTANNHVNDFGLTGRENTARVLQSAGMHFAGLDRFPYTIYDTLGLRIAYCAFSPHTGTVSIFDYAGAARLVSHLDSLCDIVIVGFHGGAEGKDYQHVTREDETFLGNDRGDVYRFAHTVIDAGADLVIGSGPHVVRAMEFYKGRLVAYSLGNFCTWSRFNLSGSQCPGTGPPGVDGQYRQMSQGPYSFLLPARRGRPGDRPGFQGSAENQRSDPGRFSGKTRFD